MTNCDGCGQESGKLYCGKCRAKLESLPAPSSQLVPLLFFDRKTKLYHAGCTVFGCPCNSNGICKTGHLFLQLMKSLFHEFDGDNCIQQACG